ncbi:class I SAM-dependent methyltransferase [Streptacidiphilus sp. 4-A2]|nr:class I SAM-dependent methyltransferase [Streptacidiphilus sp. 4-A2]
MSWIEAGRAWGERATDWAYLMEPYARSANDALFDRVGVPGRGCSTSRAAPGTRPVSRPRAGRMWPPSTPRRRCSRSRGAHSGCRIPGRRHVRLPFEDGRFDAATSFNGIWKGCEDALREARRVVRPGGLVGFTFWGSPRRLGLLPYFAALMELSPPSHVDATLNQGDTGRPESLSRCSPTPVWNTSTGEP